MYDRIEFELARQRQEELLCEAYERRASGRMSSRELTTRVRRLMRFLQPERNGGLAAAEKPGVPIHGCSAD